MLSSMYISSIRSSNRLADQGSAFWVIASRQLVVLNIASHGEQPLDELPALLVRALPN